MFTRIVYKMTGGCGYMSVLQLHTKLINTYKFDSMQQLRREKYFPSTYLSYNIKMIEFENMHIL